MEIFWDNESGYVDWRWHHPRGFVLNVYKAEAPSNPIMLHRSNCYWITDYSPGRYTTGDYYKACEDDQALLEGEAHNLIGTFKRCGHCKP